MMLTYALHGVRFSVRADEPLVEEIRGSVMPPCLVSGGGRGAAFAVERSGRRLRVSRGRQRLWTAASAAELVPWLEAEIVHWLLAKLGRYVQLHAAVVQRRGRAVLIAGGPESGKTSLACALGLAGWNVMSDEVALVEPGRRTVRSFPRVLMVRDGTARRLPGLSRVRPRRVALGGTPELVRYVSPEALGGPVRPRATIGALAFVERAGRSFVRPVGQTEAVEALLASAFGSGVGRRRCVATCIDLACAVPAYRVRVGHPRGAADALRRVCGGSG